jgi:hypothetical protein
MVAEYETNSETTLWDRRLGQSPVYWVEEDSDGRTWMDINWNYRKIPMRDLEATVQLWLRDGLKLMESVEQQFETGIELKDCSGEEAGWLILDEEETRDLAYQSQVPSTEVLTENLDVEAGEFPVYWDIIGDSVELSWQVEDLQSGEQSAKLRTKAYIPEQTADQIIRTGADPRDYRPGLREEMVEYWSDRMEALRETNGY